MVSLRLPIFFFINNLLKSSSAILSLCIRWLMSCDFMEESSCCASSHWFKFIVSVGFVAFVFVFFQQRFTM